MTWANFWPNSDSEDNSQVMSMYGRKPTDQVGEKVWKDVSKKTREENYWTKGVITFRNVRFQFLTFL